MSSQQGQEGGVDRAVLLMFAGIVLVLFVVVSAMGFGEIERSAKASARERMQIQVDLPPAEIGN